MVVIPQEPMKMVNGEWVPSADLTSLVQYGEPVVCLPHGRIALSPGPAVAKMKDVMRNFGDDDYLVCVGDPSLIGMAAAIAAYNNRGRFTLLKWDRNIKQYIKVAVNIN